MSATDAALRGTETGARTIRVGVIGTGGIGTDHATRLARSISGSTVSAVADIDRARAQDVAAQVGGARVFADGFELIRADEVDAVLIASIGETHAAFTLAAIEAGKPVLCEKPLAPTTAECEQVLAAEVAHGSRLVVVGYMRRYDPGYQQVKASLEAGAIGEPLMLHNVHRNPAVPESYTSFMTMTDSMIHEVDTTRWLLGEEIVAVQVIPPKRTPKAFAHLQDPQFAVFTTESGILSTVEFFANCQYGYDVRCELVGSEGTSSLVNPVVASQAVAGADAAPIPQSWRVRFGAAYAAELQAWISGLQRGETVGPSAWEGYAATRVVELGVEAVRSGERLAIDYIQKPALYA
ncbi:MAG TPA: Gfo/Idh/MocA family oxidoreductase [Candidatus Limnocylindrales bacterium]|nr:Gfo/Idh/MocA family oxidoreductase [Candidatus Limnocylindrales bacterium]